MGLDMYLVKKRFMWSNERDKLKVTGIKLPKRGQITEMTMDAVYWRKANHIHKWFVDNLQEGKDNCEEYFVPVEKLKELLEICQKIKKKPNLGKTLLPTSSGFFFGNTEYGEEYMDDIDHTIKELTEELKHYDEKWDYYYSASW